MPIAVVVAVITVLAPEIFKRVELRRQKRELLRSAAGAGAIAAGPIKTVHGAAEMQRADPNPSFSDPRFLIQGGIRAARDFPSYQLSDSAALGALHNLQLLAEGALYECDRLEKLATRGQLTDSYLAHLRDQADQADAAWRQLARLPGASPDELNQMVE